MAALTLQDSMYRTRGDMFASNNKTVIRYAVFSRNRDTCKFEKMNSDSLMGIYIDENKVMREVANANKGFIKMGTTWHYYEKVAMTIKFEIIPPTLHW